MSSSPTGRSSTAARACPTTTAPPDLSYVAKDLNVHNGRSTTTTTNSDGILPGRAYKSIGAKPVVNAVALGKRPVEENEVGVALAGSSAGPVPARRAGR